jgi:phage gp36-like protein
MYCTLADIQATVPVNDLIQLTDDTVPPATVNQMNVDRAITDAGELIDGYLRGRYTLPLSPVPGLINTLAADVAVYRLYARRIKLTPPEGVTERYKNALKILEQVQAGKITLGAESTGGEVTPVAGGPQFTGSERVFTREALGDY